MIHQGGPIEKGRTENARKDPAALSVRQLTKSFGGLTAADHVSFDLFQGARCALIGPNGAGKTTVVNLISGALSATAGSVHLFGQDISAIGQPGRVKKGLVRTFQIGKLFRDQTVIENVRLAILHQRGQGFSVYLSARDRDDIDGRAQSVLGLLKLTDRSNHFVANLSYGEQRLVEIAIGLVLEPKVFLLDEPAAGVPKSESGAIIDILQNLPDELAILLIEHDMDLVFRFANRVLVMLNGSLHMDGSAKEISRSKEIRDIYFGKAHAHG